MPIEIGQPFPAFSLPAMDSSGAQKVETNDSLRGQKVVIFVYPKDQTSGCSVEACNFRDLNAQFAAQNVKIFGISRDSLRSHSNFIAKQSLNFPLLSDEGGAWLKENGLIYEAKMYGKPVTKAPQTVSAIFFYFWARRLIAFPRGQVVLCALISSDSPPLHSRPKKK